MACCCNFSLYLINRVLNPRWGIVPVLTFLERVCLSIVTFAEKEVQFICLLVQCYVSRHSSPDMTRNCTGAFVEEKKKEKNVPIPVALF